MNPTSDTSHLVASRPAYSVLLVIVLLHVGVGGYLQATDLPFGIAFDELLFFAAIPGLAALAMNFRPGPFLGLRAPAAGSWPWILLAAVAAFFFAGGVNIFNRLLVGPELAQRFDPTRLFLDRSPFGLAALVFGVVVLAPVGEEIFFRGYLLRILGARYGNTGGLLVTSALFALLHVNPASFLALFVLGLAFGALRLWTGSLFPSILAHAVQNGITSVVLLAGLGGPPDEEPTAAAGFLMLIVAGPILVASLRVLRKQRGIGTDAGLPGDGPPPVVEGQDHGFEFRRIRRPLALLSTVAIVSLILLFALR